MNFYGDRFQFRPTAQLPPEACPLLMQFAKTFCACPSRDDGKAQGIKGPTICIIAAIFARKVDRADENSREREEPRSYGR